MDLILDPCENRLCKDSTKYLNAPIWVRMRPWWPSKVGAVLESESSVKTCWIWTLSFLGQKWRGVLVENIGNTCTWPPINFFGPPCLPCVFNTLFDPCMYFWKWQWTHIMVQHQFIKCIKYNHGKGCFTCESKVANVVESRHVMSSSFSDTNWYEPARVNPDLSMREGG